MPDDDTPTLRQRLLAASDDVEIEPVNMLGSWVGGEPSDEQWHGPYVNALLAVIVPVVDELLTHIANLSGQAYALGSVDAVYAYDEVHTLIIDRLRDPLKEGLPDGQ